MNTEKHAEMELREVPFDLSDAEVVAKADRLFQVEAEVAGQEAKLADYKKRHKEWLGGRLTDIRKLKGEISARREFREVEVLVRKDFEKNEVLYLYKGEVVDSHPMPNSMRQGRLFDDPHSDRPELPRFPEDEGVGSVIREETSRRTKRSAVDGPVGGEA